MLAWISGDWILNSEQWGWLINWKVFEQSCNFDSLNPFSKFESCTFLLTNQLLLGKVIFDGIAFAISIDSVFWSYILSTVLKSNLRKKSEQYLDYWRISLNLPNYLVPNISNPCIGLRIVTILHSSWFHHWCEKRRSFNQSEVKMSSWIFK